MSKQFQNRTERTTSFVYSTSLGKSGLYTPADYINNNLSSETENACDNSHTHAWEEDDLNEDYMDGIDTNVDSISHVGDVQPFSDEQAPLLNNDTIDSSQTYETLKPKIHTTKSNASVSKHRNSLLFSKKLVNEERDLLKDNKLLNAYNHPNYNPSLDNSFNEVSDEEEREIIATWESAIQSGKKITTTYKREVQVLATNAFPLIFTFILQNSLSVASILSVSHLGTKELGGVTLGSMTANITGFAAIQGLCTCLDTLCSQAYGAKNYHLVGVLLQRCCILTIIAFLPIMYIWWFWSESLLELIITEKELCILAANYLKVIAFGVPGFILFECGKRFLQCQGIFHASTIVLAFCAPLNALMNYLLVWNSKIGIGYLGAPVSVAINYWAMALGLYLYTVMTDHDVVPMKCWNGFIKTDQVFKNWRKMFNLALPGIVMVEAEFLGFEILTIFSSRLGPEVLGAQSIVSTIASLAYQIPFSISIATSTRVANFIGASLHKACVITCEVSLLLSFVCSTMNIFIIFNFKVFLAKLFSNEPEVVELVIKTLPYLAFMQLFDAFNASTAGCLRGQGRQKIGGYINLFAFYCVGIPLSYILAFKFGFGIIGLWSGITCALFTMSIFQGYAVFHVNWKDIIAASKNRNAEHVSVCA
ncbi:hypothetical protein TPHA_0E02260 [Tetrapisispora phaffii CBS 4417]|uniref:Ethionine resistance-conferring protein 1 n=1 Tax=Tetrapisispora phaffii (strain ATCC 24235 / CBS 4417 / NBRC 1672 / NRRL Y-8282 / UCD 70-5) TaxID=1071381 RepID=G8BTU0_TETPH|nr:hypothetical protein TPHA_0E02260 [Tetrapisispora phaffii CBS 4417]CCE63318.1 hypothetical protein TPHA_0E02260 [Tetrapisispora phaffii CBS 4417]